MNQPYNFIHGLIVNFGDSRFISAILGSIFFLRAIPSKRLGIYISTLKINGNIDPHRPRSSDIHKMPCFFHVISYVCGILEHHRILAHMLSHAGYVILLISERTKSLAVILFSHELMLISHRCVITHLTAHYEHRKRIKPASEYARYCICSAGARSHTKSRNSSVIS